MSQIKDYLEQGRANKVFDPNQGLYIDPVSKKAFVPTFTNVTNSNIQGQVQEQMGGPQAAQADPYLVGNRPMPANQPGAMPTPGMPGAGEAQKGPDPRDPWAMANEHMKSKGFKEEIYRQMFGDRDPSQGFQSAEERDMFLKGLQSVRNVLVDRFKWQIERKDKQDKIARESAAKNIDPKEYYKEIKEARIRLKGIYDTDPAAWQAEHGDKTPNEVAREEVESILKDYNEFAGGNAPGGGAMPGRDQVETKAAMQVDKNAVSEAGTTAANTAQEMPDKDSFSEYQPGEDRFSYKELAALDKTYKPKMLDFMESYAIANGVDPQTPEGKEWLREKLVNGRFTRDMAEAGDWKEYLKNHVDLKKDIKIARRG